jgi:RNA polymerase sigma factor (sigma-70 family)
LRQGIIDKQTRFFEDLPFSQRENDFLSDDSGVREHKEIVKEIQVFVETLNPTLQEVFYKHFLLGLSHKEMAKERGITLKHSRTDLSRLVKKLQRKFK